jgi:hypothetical protein
MANACADELQIDEAQKLAALLDRKELQDRAYTHLVDALLKADRAAEAGQFADRISDARLQAVVRGRIAAKSAKKESVKTLQLRIEQAATREEKLAIYDLLFAKLVEAGNVAAAEAAIDSIVKTIEASPREAQASKFGTFDDAAAIAMARSKYLAIAVLLAKKGDREGSRLRLARAQKAVTELSANAGIGKSILVLGFVQAEIDLGDFSGARSTLGQLEKGFQRSTSAASVAVGLIRSGDVKSGLEVAELITPSVGSGSAIGKVAAALLAAGELKATKALLQKIGDGRDDVDAFRTVGQNMAHLGRLAELHQWIGELKSNTARAYLCMGAAETLHRTPGDKARSTQP